ncbi:MAG: succinate dehydrogenase [Chlamydiia bacterium]|nr:succinate dehydrogenase [Chlamydiia bacterium]
MSVQTSSISSAFLWRRVHSLAGFWLVLYLIIHLITNSQAALWIGDDGHGFVRLVNFLESLPYLQIVETVLIGVPLAVHAVWGIKRALTARFNVHTKDGHTPALAFPRNRAFAWQRLSSWVLLVGIIWHVFEMRFHDAPKRVASCSGEQYLVQLDFDEGLYTLAARLHVTLFTPADTDDAARRLRSMGKIEIPKKSFMEAVRQVPYDSDEDMSRVMMQNAKQERAWLQGLSSFHLREGQVVASAPVPGVAMLLMVRDTFKSPWMAVFYTVFVLAAAFHAFNGFWTFLITWGIILSYRAQRRMSAVSVAGMGLLAVLGLIAIWCSYWINLRY